MKIAERLDEFRACFDDSPQPFCIVEMLRDEGGNAADFRFVYLNGPFSALAGRETASLSGKRFYEVFEGADRKWPDLCGKIAFEGGSGVASGYSPERDKHLSILCYQLEEGYCACLASDVTEARRLERLCEEQELAMRTERQKIEAALENTSLYLWEYDIRERRCLHYNNAVKELGIERVVGNTPYATLASGIIDEDSARDFIELHKKIDAGEPSASAEIKVRDAGGVRWKKFSYNTVRDDAGRPVRAVGCSVDITSLKEMERRFEEEKRYQEATGGENSLTKARANITKDVLEIYRAGPNVGICREGISFGMAIAALAGTALRDEKKKEIFQTFSNEAMSRPISLEERPAAVEYLRKTNDGEVIWARTTAKRFVHPETRDIMCFLYTYDISRGKNPEIITKRITEIEYDRIVLIDASTGAMTVYQSLEDGCFEAANYRAELDKILRGYVAEEELPDAFRMMALKNICRELEEHELFSCSFNVTEKKGRKARKKWQFCYLDEIRRLILATKSDVTEIFNEQTRQQEILKEALAQAEQASLAKSEFLSRMSHEIRTPMNAIIGMSAIAAQCVNDPAQVSDCLAKVGISARFLLSLINDILDMSRIESGKVVIKKERIPFEEFINGINTICSEQAGAKGVDYDCIMTTFTESAYVGDPMKLQQILINIIANAIKFTPKGGKVQFIVSQDRISAGNAHMRFSINDTGIGIKEEFLPKLFDPFEQEHAGAASIYGGTGLGLAISKNLAELMGGSITVHSIEGIGSEFVVSLPLDLCEERLAPGRLKSSLNLASLSALVVDDEVTICEHTARILGDMGMRADWVDSGMKAVERVKQKWDRREFYDVILIDWKMPEMDGIETARRIRRIVGPEVTIIIITAYDWGAIESEAKNAGVNMLISKPLFKNSLTSAFEKIYSGSGGGEAPAPQVRYDFSGSRVLLAEDHLLNVEVAKRILTNKGLEVEVAENGLAAIEAFVANPAYYYDLILMDIRMPLMDGLTAAKSIRHTKKADARSIPIIAMSANAFDEDVEKSKSAGMNEHLAKPIDPNLLYETLARYLKTPR